MIQAFGLTSIPRKAHPPAVDDVTFEARAGRVTALLGEAGAGKTTVLRLMLELQQGRGLTYFRGRPLHRIAHPAREVGVLLGDVPGHPSRSVRGHLRMLCAATGVPARRADEVLEAVGLVSLREERLGTLSHGMDRRLGLACALLPAPHTLVLDEPTDGLPSREAQWLHRMLRAHAAQGGTVLFTTADPKEAARAADRVVTLKSGRLVADQEAREFARTRLRPRVAVRSPHADRLAAVLSKEARIAHRSVEVVREGGNRLCVYGSTTAEVGEAAFRHGILVHQLADETGDMGPGAVLPEPSTGEVPEEVLQEPNSRVPAAADEGRSTRELTPGASRGERTAVESARPACPQRAAGEASAAGRQDAPRADRRTQEDTPAVAPQPRAERAAPSLAQQSHAAGQEPSRSRSTAAEEPRGAAEPQPSATAAGLADDSALMSLPATPDTEFSAPARPSDQLPAPASAKPSTTPGRAQPSVSLGSAEPAGHGGATRTAPAVPAQPPAATSAQPLTRTASVRAVMSVEATTDQSPTHAVPTEGATAQPVARGLSHEAQSAQPPTQSGSAEAAVGEPPNRDVPAEGRTSRLPADSEPVSAEGRRSRPAADSGLVSAEGRTSRAPAHSGPAETPTVRLAGGRPQPESQPSRGPAAGDEPAAPAPVGPARRDEAVDDPGLMSPLPPPISVRPAPSPLRPLRYELRRAAGIGAGFLTCGAVLLVSALTAVLLARAGHTPQARLFAAWPRELPLPPAAFGAGLLGALAFGDEFRHPALAADRGTVPRRLGLLTAKLLVSGATSVLLSFLTVGCDAEVLYLVYGRELVQVPADWFLLTVSWFGLIVGCAWAGVLAAGVFRSTTAGLAAVLAVPVLVVPVVHEAVQGTGVRMAAGLPMRLRETFLLKWPFGGERYLAGAARVLAQPVGGALALSLAALLCAYLFSTLRARVR
ncbi:ATP-binding cassette domain-containing protein [Streptomyces sp. R39]|uniref:ATP-binding cassette domain-containing protein n=1 Tax=Streptomyces sp. R39 TaxID=3238631 RepID=A0AB39QWL2_9ACTN